MAFMSDVYDLGGARRIDLVFDGHQHRALVAFDGRAGGEFGRHLRRREVDFGEAAQVVAPPQQHVDDQ